MNDFKKQFNTNVNFQNFDCLFAYNSRTTGPISMVLSTLGDVHTEN